MLAAATTNMIRRMTIAIESANGELASRLPKLSGRMFSTLVLVYDRYGEWGRGQG